jgi:hypothetical protein
MGLALTTSDVTLIGKSATAAIGVVAISGEELTARPKKF